MKPIDQMSLVECIEIFKRNFRHPDFHNATITGLANRIEELTKWISVNERTPTEKDGPSVLVKSGEVSGWYRVVPYMYANGFNGYSHWKRVEP